MGKGYKLTLGIITVMMLLTISVGTSYSYYSIAQVQEEENTFATACFDSQFTESNYINLTKAYPMTAATAIGNGTNGKVTPYTFTIQNKCSNTTLKYVVTLSPLTTGDALTNYIDYNISDSSQAIVAQGQSLKAAQLYTNLPEQYKNGLARTYQIAEGTLEGGTSKSYNLYLWIDEAATIDIQGQSFSGKVQIYVYV